MYNYYVERKDDLMTKEYNFDDHFKIITVGFDRSKEVMSEVFCEKSDPDLVHPNSAVIRDNGLPIIVSIKNLYKEKF
jgi:hypothetical protein